MSEDKLIEKNLVIKNLTVADLTIRVLETGRGSPKIALVNGLHGLERTGAYLMSKIYSKIRLNKGTVSFIPFANPTSAWKNTRLTPEDFQDLNRVFPGNPRGTYSFQLAATLFDYLKNFDLVIDIHTFPKMQMPIVGVYLAGAPKEQKETLLNLLKIFGPDYIWKLDTKSDEKNKAGSLDEALTTFGRLAFSLELPDIELIKPEQEKRFVDGLQRVIKSMAKGNAFKSKRNIPIITRVPAVSPQDGFFVPFFREKTLVKKDQLIGELISMKDFSKTPVLAPTSGPIVFILNKTFVLPGERLVLIGKKVADQDI